MKNYLNKFNKKIDLVKNLKILAVTLLFLAGFSFVSSWIGPTGAPGTDNISAPINSGTSTQYKFGNLVIKDDPELVDGALEGSLVSDKIDVVGSPTGPSYFFSQFNVGSPYIATGAGTDPKLIAEANATITFSELNSTNNPEVTYPARVCIDSMGIVYICENSPAEPEEPYTASSRITIVSQTFNDVDYSQDVSCPADYPVPIASGAVCLDGSNAIKETYVWQSGFVEDPNGVLMNENATAKAMCEGDNYDIKIWVTCAK